MKKYDEIRDFYANRANEDERMMREPLEYMRCKEIISRYLNKQNMRIADIGGATGVFALWLARQDHEVHLVDLLEQHIAKARENAMEAGIELASYTCADARELPFADAIFDLVLEMGPLYHLQEARDREACLLEAYRTLKKGGTLICEVIGRYASLIDGFKYALVRDIEFQKILQEDVISGRHSPDIHSPYFTTSFFHTSKMIREELEDSGFSNIRLIAVEGFATGLAVEEILKDDLQVELLLRYIKQTESEQDLMGMSGHIIAVANK